MTIESGYIFLNVDNIIVLQHSEELNIDSINNLKKLIDNTNASIVLTSGIRTDNEKVYRLREFLAAYGIRIASQTLDLSKHIFDKLRYRCANVRAVEITEYVVVHGLTNWVVLDDQPLIMLAQEQLTDKLFQDFKRRFIRVHADTGITSTNIVDAIKILIPEENEIKTKGDSHEEKVTEGVII